MARWLDVVVIASPAVPLLGLGLLQTQAKGSLTALVPFVLIALLTVTVMSAVYGTVDSAASARPEPYRPKSRWGARAYVVGMLLLPVTLLAVTAVLVAQQQWLPAAVLLATTIAPTVLRARLWATTRRASRQSN